MLENTILYQINLDRRTDRWAECQANHQAMGFAPGEIRRISAVPDENFGLVGCTRSHIKAMTEFFVQERAEYGLFLEDDFDFVMPKTEIQQKLQELQQRGLDFDVILLAGTHAISLNVGMPHVEKLMDARSCCAYLIRRSYISTLVPCFMDSVSDLERYRYASPREAFVHWFALDMVWRNLQKKHKWFIFHPMAGYQRPSYSDLENRHTDYTNLFKLADTQTNV